MVKRHDIWTPKDDEYVIKNYPKGNITKMAEHLGRTERAIIQRASSVLNVYQKSHWKLIPWTEDDEEYLRQNWPSGDLQEIMDHLHRTESALKSRAFLLNVKRVPNKQGKVYNEIIEAQKRYHAKEKDKMGVDV